MADNSEVAVVTGANSGIGRATAIHLARNGYTVFGTARGLEKAKKANSMAAEAGVELQWVEMDVADDASTARGLAEVFERAGRIDVLVNNAGVGGNAVVEECPPSLYHEVMNVNLYGVVRCVQAVLPHMRERGSGTIINISSVVGRFAALAQAPYVASKWALEAMSEGLAQEVAPFGIRVAMVEPGIEVGHLRQEHRRTEFQWCVRRAVSPNVPVLRGGHGAGHRPVRGGRRGVERHSHQRTATALSGVVGWPRVVDEPSAGERRRLGAFGRHRKRCRVLRRVRATLRGAYRHLKSDGLGSLASGTERWQSGQMQPP